MRQQTDFSESGWTGPGMMEPIMPSTVVPPSAPSPMMGESGMEESKPKRAAVRKRKKAAPKAKPKAKKKAKSKRPKAKAKAKRPKAKRKPARRRR